MSSLPKAAREEQVNWRPHRSASVSELILQGEESGFKVFEQELSGPMRKLAGTRWAEGQFGERGN